jgi:Zn-dependent peptidase ImmA (M78 family)
MVKIHYTGSREDAQSFIDRIQSVISVLPEDIQQKIHVESIIFIIDTCYGYYIGKSDNKIILLNSAQMKKDQLNIQDQEYIIAHEFAHFILNHTESTTKQESEAKDLVDYWGFSKNNQ